MRGRYRLALGLALLVGVVAFSGCGTMVEMTKDRTGVVSRKVSGTGAFVRDPRDGGVLAGIGTFRDETLALVTDPDADMSVAADLDDGQNVNGTPSTGGGTGTADSLSKVKLRMYPTIDEPDDDSGAEEPIEELPPIDPIPDADHSDDQAMLDLSPDTVRLDTLPMGVWIERG